MLWIGLTGGIASGKSTVAKILRELGFAVVDADEVARQVVSPGSELLSRIEKEFGSDVLHPDQSLNRARMAEIVFEKPLELARLESLIHPEIQKEVATRRHALVTSGVSVAFYDVPLLFEKKMESQFDKIVVVACRPEQQRERLTKKGFSQVDISNRMAAQIPLIDKEKKAHYVIRNDSSLEDLRANVSACLTAAGIPRPT